MTYRTIPWMVGVVLVGMLALFLVNLQPTKTEALLEPKDALGVTFEVQGIPFRVPQDKVDAVVKDLNTSVPVRRDHYKTITVVPEVSSIKIKLKSGDEIEITPITYRELNMVYDAPAWNTKEYMMELSGGQLTKTLESIYKKS